MNIFSIIAWFVFNTVALIVFARITETRNSNIASSVIFYILIISVLVNAFIASNCIINIIMGV